MKVMELSLQFNDLPLKEMRGIGIFPAILLLCQECSGY